MMTVQITSSQLEYEESCSSLQHDNCEHRHSHQIVLLKWDEVQPQNNDVYCLCASQV